MITIGTKPIAASSGTGDGVPASDLMGLIAGFDISRKDASEIYVSGGMIEINGGLYRKTEVTPHGCGDAVFVYTENLCSGGTADASSNTETVSRCFDGSTSASWLGGSAGSGLVNWVEYAFPESERIQKYRLFISSGAGDRQVELRASETGAFSGEEVTLDAWNTAGVAGWAERDADDFANSGTHMYYRIYFDGAWYLYEIEMMAGDYGATPNAAYYVYAAIPASGKVITTAEISVVNGAPLFNASKGADYHPTDGNMRFIGSFSTDALGIIGPTTFKKCAGANRYGILVNGGTIPVLSVIQGNAPASETSPGTKGEIRFESDYIYICVAQNSWKRLEWPGWDDEYLLAD